MPLTCPLCLLHRNTGWTPSFRKKMLAAALPSSVFVLLSLDFTPTG
ncbi:hypothetical protein LEMLEM_LOCUS11067 [Lemmus lemmus]